MIRRILFCLNALLITGLSGQIPNGPAICIDQNTSNPLPAASGTISLPGTPSSSQYVPLRLGHVDAVTGGMNLSLPLGPKLPGRIPLGFSWVFDSTSSPRMNATSGSSILTVKAGGILSPIVWPSPLASSPQVTAWINGQSHTFLKKSAPLAMSPDPRYCGMAVQARDDRYKSVEFGYCVPFE